MKLNNIHIDPKSFKIVMNDYGLYNDIYRGFKTNTVNTNTNIKSDSLENHEIIS